MSATVAIGRRTAGGDGGGVNSADPCSSSTTSTRADAEGVTKAIDTDSSSLVVGRLKTGAKMHWAPGALTRTTKSSPAFHVPNTDTGGLTMTASLCSEPRIARTSASRIRMSADVAVQASREMAIRESEVGASRSSSPALATTANPD